MRVIEFQFITGCSYFCGNLSPRGDLMRLDAPWFNKRHSNITSCRHFIAITLTRHDSCVNFFSLAVGKPPASFHPGPRPPYLQVWIQAWKGKGRVPCALHRDKLHSCYYVTEWDLFQLHATSLYHSLWRLHQCTRYAYIPCNHVFTPKKGRSEVYSFARFTMLQPSVTVLSQRHRRQL